MEETAGWADQWPVLRAPGFLMTTLHTLRKLKITYAPLNPFLREDEASCILAYFAYVTKKKYALR